MSRIGPIFLFATISATIACSGSSPTAPTPLPPIVNIPPVVVAPPPVVTPPAPPVVVPPAPAFPPTDPRFDLAFYRMFVHNAYEGPVLTLRRQSEAPRIYLKTIDESGSPIDTFTLNETARALETTTGALTGAFGLAGIERGTGTRVGQRGWITVEWSHLPNERDPNYSFCGQSQIAGTVVTLYPKSRWCRCDGGPAVMLSIVKHELGHALGFHHTNDPRDLMYQTYSACDQQPTAREQYHAALAYTRPIGSVAP